MEAFWTALEECNLGDLGYSGPKFTWSNKRQDDTYSQERLDRAVGNRGWCDMYKSARVLVMAARASDHNPIFVSFSNKQPWCTKGRRGFKFEASWIPDEECGAIINESWEGGETDGEAMKKVRRGLERCKSRLKWWSRKKFGKNENLIKEKTEVLANLQTLEGPEHHEAIKRLPAEIETLLEFEDMRWKQRAKQNWYREGDRNTPFFHAWGSHRRRINTIKKVVDVKGREWLRWRRLAMLLWPTMRNYSPLKGQTEKRRF
ncbi:uncharacterized protein LOC132178000 [Corylus avellana]|uniref:uncharacterized protein LOC132178000 n=1 Tax=Corylus avellana TaxID=13451 RepID=UPI00286CD556|nr:uncharacterized protein LOC132178000 [Corylus avellana]